MFTPWWKNLITIAVTIQYAHRTLAYFIIAYAVGLYALSRVRGTTRERRWATVMVMLIFVQAGWGVATLLSVVNPWLACAHLVFAMGLVGVLAHELGRSWSFHAGKYTKRARQTRVATEICGNGGEKADVELF